MMMKAARLVWAGAGNRNGNGDGQKAQMGLLSFEKKLPHPANSICLLIHAASKRIENSKLDQA